MLENSKKIVDDFLNNLVEHENKTTTFDVIKKRNYDMKKIIEISNLVKEFKIKKVKFKAINDLSLDIYKNQNVALLGSNGAGKTTLVEMIVGISKPTSGKIKYFFDKNEENNSNGKIGIQFQDSSYPQGLTVNDVIKSVNKIYGNITDEDELKKIEKIFGIDEFLNNKAASLSGGQHQRLNALLAIINKPELLILDELSTGLDIKIKTRLMYFLKDFIKANNNTLLLVSHDINEIKTLADRIVIINKGKVIYDKTKEEAEQEFGSVEKCLDYYI
ncbi:ABC transporter ATP-binding protein [Mycoplasma elephantis]|uniref:ABC transporter ATP-binding protein n=1 Tax=Mycoplasma elephantis TaxID=114882 RepID=UPI000A0751E3|nr:ABC transporter ATP-binding protein [Mycoplasma elephantis]